MIALRLAAWIITLIYATVPVYWLLVHPRAGRWQAAGGRRLLAIGPAWPLLWPIAALATWPWHDRAFYNVRWTWIPGLLLIGSGLAIYRLASKDFSFSTILGRPELEPAKHHQRLRTGGIRARIRHPYYLGHACELLGWAVGSGLIVPYALVAITVVTGYFMIRAEERELRERFGEAYRQYQRTTAALLPGIW